MDALIYAVGLYGICIANALIMYTLAWFLTEVIQLPWKVKPFTCRGCMAFWLTAFSGTVIGWWLADGVALMRYLFAGIAVLSGLTSYFYIKSKFQIYE